MKKGKNNHSLDIEFGLRMLSGETELYEKLLQKFSENYYNAPFLIKGMIEEGKINEAGIMAHSIKGLSGNMGALKLKEICAHLENKLKNNEHQDVHETLEKLEEEVDQVIMSIYEYMHSK